MTHVDYENAKTTAKMQAAAQGYRWNQLPPKMKQQFVEEELKRAGFLKNYFLM
jgi:hypothetical protein